MLKAANVSIENTLQIFNSAGVATGLLVPTPTGFHKSIMDATLSFRDFLHESGTHEYSAQKQGPEHKVIVPARFVLPDRCVQTKASLYRPCTKKGDPRIWFSKLTRYCKPTDLLAVISHGGSLYIFNMSNEEVVRSFALPGSYPHDILSDCSETISTAARELLGKLKKIHRDGFVEGKFPGDRNVGSTLESLLGIPQNSRKTPDYKGIELKTARGKSPTTLFNKTPDWERSAFSARDILEKFGHPAADYPRKFYCTVSNIPNPQGLYLDASDEQDLVNRVKSEAYTGEIAVWALDTLKRCLAEKHKETFWVKAKCEKCDGKEFFRYDIVKHTRKPNVANLGSMFEAGIITLDYRIRLEKNGKTIRDKGYGFRIVPSKRKYVFPLERIYDLAI